MIKLKDLAIGEAFQLAPNSHIYLIIDQGEQLTYIQNITRWQYRLDNRTEAIRISPNVFCYLEESVRGLFGTDRANELGKEMDKEVTYYNFSNQERLKLETAKKDPPKVFSGEDYEAALSAAKHAMKSLPPAWDSVSKSMQSATVSMREAAEKLARISKGIPPYNSKKTSEISEDDISGLLGDIPEEFQKEIQSENKRGFTEIPYGYRKSITNDPNYQQMKKNVKKRVYKRR